MNEDDDIPVLTSILRTGSARDAQGVATASASALSAEAPAGSNFSARRSAQQDVDADATDPAPVTDALVIGNAPHADPVASAGLAAFDDDDEAHDPARYAVTDDVSPTALGADVFRLPQDHDHAVANDARTPLDVPEIVDVPDRSSTMALVGSNGSAGQPERRMQPFAADQQRERRVVPSVAHEPRDRRLLSDDVSLQRLASITSSVRDSVLVALQTRIDTELDARIAQAMHREVETAIAQLQDKLRDGLTEALRDVVARAVDDEMTRFVTVEREAAARLDPRKPPGRHDL